MSQTGDDILVAAEDGDRDVGPSNVPDVEAEVEQLGAAGQVERPLRTPLDTRRRRDRLDREDGRVDVALIGTRVEHLRQNTRTHYLSGRLLRLVGGVAQWFGRRSLAGGLSLNCA